MYEFRTAENSTSWCHVFLIIIRIHSLTTQTYLAPLQIKIFKSSLIHTCTILNNFLSIYMSMHVVHKYKYYHILHYILSFIYPAIVHTYTYIHTLPINWINHLPISTYIRTYEIRIHTDLLSNKKTILKKMYQFAQTLRLRSRSKIFIFSFISFFCYFKLVPSVGKKKKNNTNK